MSSTSRDRTKQPELPLVLNGSANRRLPLRILFIHRDVADVEHCVQELRRAHFRLTTDVVLTPEQFAARLKARFYDIVLAEYPSSNWQGRRELEMLRLRDRRIPCIFLTRTMQPEIAAELITSGAADCVSMDHLGHLPVAVRRALSDNHLREERDRTEKRLRHSEARRSIYFTAADAQDIGQPAESLTADEVAETIVDLFQAVQIEEQKCELTRGALGALDLIVHGFHQMAVVREARQRIFGRLLTQMILELALLRDVFNDDFVTFRLALIFDRAAAEADFDDCAVFPFPFRFEGIRAIEFRRAAQQLRSFRGISENVSRQVHGQQFLAGRITQHGGERWIDVEELSFEIAAADSVD